MSGSADSGNHSDELTRLGRKHVFVVNGSPMFLDLMRLVLNEESYNVTTTNFVPRTFDQIAALQPDLLIIDVAVTHESGWELLSELRRSAATSGIPVIVVSTDPALLERAQAEQNRYGGQLFLSKPFNLDDILVGVRGLIGPA